MKQTSYFLLASAFAGLTLTSCGEDGSVDPNESAGAGGSVLAASAMGGSATIGNATTGPMGMAGTSIRGTGAINAPRVETAGLQGADAGADAAVAPLRCAVDNGGCGPATNWQCTDDGDAGSGPICQCQPGFEGADCTDNFDDCTIDNGGCGDPASVACTDGATANAPAVCTCAIGFEGTAPNCTDIDECAIADVCTAPRTECFPSAVPGQAPTCGCPPGLSGASCQIQLQGNPCAVATQAADCAGNALTPVCEPTFLVCVQCASNTDCEAGQICGDNNLCGQCSSAEGCAAGQACDASLNLCVTACSQDADCAGEVVNTSCRVADGACVQCNETSDCNSGVCDPFTNVCETCVVDADCANVDPSTVCDPATLQCVPG